MLRLWSNGERSRIQNMGPKVRSKWSLVGLEYMGKEQWEGRRIVLTVL